MGSALARTYFLRFGHGISGVNVCIPMISLKYGGYMAPFQPYKRKTLFFSTVKSKNNNVHRSFEWGCNFLTYAFFVFCKIWVWSSNFISMTESLWPSNSLSFSQVKNSYYWHISPEQDLKEDETTGFLWEKGKKKGAREGQGSFLKTPQTKMWKC